MSSKKQSLIFIHRQLMINRREPEMNLEFPRSERVTRTRRDPDTAIQRDVGDSRNARHPRSSESACLALAFPSSGDFPSGDDSPACARSGFRVLAQRGTTCARSRRIVIRDGFGDACLRRENVRRDLHATRPRNR